MHENFKIISADVSHVDFLCSFGRESFIDAYKSTLPIKELEIYVEASFEKSFIYDEIKYSKAMYFLCQDNKSNFCGYCKLIPSITPKYLEKDGNVELQRLYVVKDFRGKGVGKLLSLWCESKAINQGFHSIWLRVWEGNLLAQKIYLKWNYLILGNEQYQVGNEKRTVLIMQKKMRSRII